MPGLEIERNFALFVIIGVGSFLLLGVVVLLTFRWIFRSLERRQVETDKELRKHGL